MSSIHNINNPNFFNTGLAQVSTKHVSTAHTIGTLPQDFTKPNPSIESEVPRQIDQFTAIPSYDNLLQDTINPSNQIDPRSLEPRTFYGNQTQLFKELQGAPDIPELKALHSLLANNSDNLEELRTRGLSLLQG